MKPLITVGIPFYNCEKTILQAVKSVFAQTYENWQLILIDDGSTDDSYALVREIKDKRVSLLSDRNRGLIYRLNQLIDLTETKYLARMDGDDIMHPDRLKEQVEYMEVRPDIDIVGTSVYTIDEEGLPIGKRSNVLITDPFHVITKGILPHSTILGKTNWFKRFKYNSAYHRAEDRELWCRTFNLSTFSLISKPLHFYREGRVNIRNYIDSQTTERKIYELYGSRMMGTGQKYMAILKSYLKQYAYMMCGAINMQDRLTKTRNMQLSSNESLAASLIISKINSQQLPGLTDHSSRKDNMLCTKHF